MKRQRKTGSALLMVVGLLTILAMLGATFLVIASMHNRLADTTGVSAPLPGIPSGILAQVASLLKDDLYIDANGCYSQAKPGALTSAEYYKWYADSADTKPVIGDAGALLFPGIAAGETVDVTGDDVADAALYQTGAYNSRGEQASAAVLVEDMSGKACVNTATQSNAAVTPTAAAKVGLDGLLGAARYSDVHLARCRGTNRTPQDFNDNCASVLAAVWNGTANYAPFTMSDEIFLRDQRLSGSTMSGRLHAALTALTNRNLLTTYAVSRSILRHPPAGRTTRLVLTRNALDDDATRTWLRDELVKALGDAGDEEQIGDPITIDNGDAGWSSTGTWTLATGNGGGAWAMPYNPTGDQDFHYSTSNDGTSTWTFSGLTESKYRVAVTWVSHTNPGLRSGNAPFTVKDGVTPLGTVLVDMKSPASEYLEDGVGWKVLGTYTISGPSVVVELSNNPADDNYVTADAVRIYPVTGGGGSTPPPGDEEEGAPITIDDGGTGWSSTGTWTLATGNGGGAWALPYDPTGDQDFRYSTSNDGTSKWTFSGLSESKYRVAVTWVSHTNPAVRSGNAPFTVKDGASPLGTVLVDMKSPASEYQEGGVGWKTVGTYTISGSSLVVELSNNPADDNYVTADAVRIYPITTPEVEVEGDPITIDNGNTGWSSTGTWTLATGNAGGYWAMPYNPTGDQDFHYSTSNDGTSKWTFSGLTESKYRVAVTWVSHTNPAARSGNAPFTVKDGAASLETVLVDMKSPASQYEEDGVGWKTLGTYTISGSSLAVELSNNPADDNYVTADAVRIYPITVQSSTPPPSEGSDTSEIDHFLANLWAYISQQDPQAQAFKVETAYGVVPQLVITEAYAYSAQESSVDVGDHSWAYAIELMNPTAQGINASNYWLKCGTATWNLGTGGLGNVAPGHRIVLYSFGGGNPAVAAGDFFTVGAGWYLVPDDKLNFAAANQTGEPVKIYRTVGSEEIPVDSISGSDIGYNVTSRQTGAGGSASPACFVGRRDDDWLADDAGRGRALVAAMMTAQLEESQKKTGHTLGAANGLQATDLTAVREGFFILRGETWPRDIGRIFSRYIVGPDTAGADLPHALIEHQASDTRGRIDYKGEVPEAPTGDYPEINWSCILGELLELNTPHAAQAPGVIYGRININTASAEVLRQLPFPTTVTARDVSFTLDDTDIEALADLIVAGRPYLTPGQVAPDLINYLLAGKLSGQEASAGYYEARSSLYDAVSNLITVNSDVYAVYIRTQVGGGGSAGAKYHIGIVDRSNCSAPADTPRVLIFSNLK